MSSERGITVFVRVRPPIAREVHEQNVIFPSGNTVSLKGDKHDITCQYDGVFDEITVRSEVFAQVQPLLDDVMNAK